MESSEALEQQSSNTVAKLKALKNMLIFGFTYLLVNASYTAIIGLQTSINIKDGLGATTLSVMFIVAAVSNIFVVPFMIDFFGAKSALIAGELGSTVFIIANLYPNWYTLMPAALVNGLIGTSMWAAGPVYVALLAEEYWVKYCLKLPHLKNETKEKNLAYFYALFYAMWFTGDLFSSCLSMVALLGFQNFGLETRVNDSVAVNGNETFAGTELPTFERALVSYESCASNECQSNYNKLNVTDEDLGNFKANPISIYILLAISTVLCIISMVMQGCLLPQHPGKFQKKTRREVKEEGHENTEEIKTSSISNVLKEISQIFHHVISPMHLLMVAYLFYGGMFYGFIMFEFPRAYVSCVIGVEQIGVMYITLNASTIFTSVFYSQIIPRTGEKWLLFFLAVTHFVGLLLMLFWIPTFDNTWSIYCLAIICGICIATSINTGTAIIARYFPDILPIAFSGQNCIVSLGISFITGWTLELCVSTKLYILIIFMLVSVLGIMGAEMLKRYKKKNQKANKHVEDQEADIVTHL